MRDAIVDFLKAAASAVVITLLLAQCVADLGISFGPHPAEERACDIFWEGMQEWEGAGGFPALRSAANEAGAAAREAGTERGDQLAGHLDLLAQSITYGEPGIAHTSGLEASKLCEEITD